MEYRVLNMSGRLVNRWIVAAYKNLGTAQSESATLAQFFGEEAQNNAELFRNALLERDKVFERKDG